MGQKIEKHHHHILPTKVAVSIGATLLILTVITVWIAHVDLGRLNFVIAMAVATVKALLVALFFMNLKYDRAENGMIFGTSFLFLAIFIVLTGTDIFFRGDVYVDVNKPLLAAVETKSKLKTPWISTPELVAKGKELYDAQCVACHGAQGKGDGPAAGALNPRPRNFTVAEGWKNGRKATMVFKTLKEGLPPSAMASFSTLPSDDRWALTHYVLSLGSTPPADSPADFAKIGIDPTKEGGGAQEAPTISVDVAMQRMAVPAAESEKNAKLFHMAQSKTPETGEPRSVGASIYESQCIQCHGEKGQGGIKVQNLGVNPVAYVTTAPFKASSDAIANADHFSRVVTKGFPGGLMPATGQLSSIEMKELYQFVKSISK